MKSAFHGRKVRLQLFGEEYSIEATIRGLKRELGSWLYEIEYPNGDIDFIPIDAVCRIGVGKNKKAKKLKFRLVK